MEPIRAAAMAQELRTELRPEARLVPVPVLHRLLRLVPLAAAEVERVVSSALDANPYLTRLDGWACPGCGRHLRSRRCPSCAATPGGRGRSVGFADDAVEPSSDEAGDWRGALAQGAALELASPADRTLAAAVVAHLDGRGLLGDTPEAVARACRAPVEAVERVLHAVRLAGPPGIAARSPLDCVRVQCRTLVAAGQAPPLLAELADSHLDDLAEGNTTDLAHRLGCPPAEVTAALALLRARVRPYPVLDAAPAAPVRPDIVVRFHPDDPERMVVEVADARWHGLAVADTPDDPRGWAAPHQAAARILVRQIDIRASLLRHIGTDLARHQRDYLIGGRGHRPLRRFEVASRLGVHPSTVGRAVSEKWLLGPTGRLTPLHACFGAATGPLDELRSLLANHPAASDRALAELLAARGHPLARRTVAKYRATLAIPARHPAPARRPARAY